MKMMRYFGLLFAILFIVTSCGSLGTVTGGGSTEPTVTYGGEALEDCSASSSTYCQNYSKYNLSGFAYKDDDENLKIVLSPVVNQTSGAVSRDLSAEDIQVTSGELTYTVQDLSTITDQVTSIDSDIVFILDTTGSMVWAIDGIKDSLIAFSDSLTEYGFDPMIGGVEYGDEVRTSVQLSTPELFRTWVTTLSATGGGDAAENPLDAYFYSENNFSFRESALKYYILITDQGFHESGDDSGFTSYTLEDLITAMKGNALQGVIHAQILDSVSGTHPKEITDTMGGIYINIEFDLTSLLESFEFDLHSTVIDLNLQYSYVITVPASEAASLSTGDTIDLEVTIDGETYSTDLVL